MVLFDSNFTVHKIWVGGIEALLESEQRLCYWLSRIPHFGRPMLLHSQIYATRSSSSVAAFMVQAVHNRLPGARSYYLYWPIGQPAIGKAHLSYPTQHSRRRTLRLNTPCVRKC